MAMHRATVTPLVGRLVHNHPPQQGPCFVRQSPGSGAPHTPSGHSDAQARPRHSGARGQLQVGGPWVPWDPNENGGPSSVVDT